MVGEGQDFQVLACVYSIPTVFLHCILQYTFVERLEFQDESVIFNVTLCLVLYSTNTTA